MASFEGKKVKTFKSMLAGLTCEKHKIGHLTQQARADLNYQATLAEVDVNSIISFIVSKAADDRLAGLYLIDSICQNVGGRFVPLFEEHIFGIIETTYRYGSSSTRKTLCKILNIWKSRRIFPIDILRKIYEAISKQQHPASSIMPKKPTSSSNNHKYPSSMPYSNQQSFRNAPPPTTTNPYHHQQPPPHHHQAPYYNNYGPPPHHQQQPGPSSYYGAPSHHHQAAPYYPPPHHLGHHPQSQQPPMTSSNSHSMMNPNPIHNGWHQMCNKYNIPHKQYENIVNELISDIDLFIQSPYTFRNGIFVETPQLKNANWQCRQQLTDEFRKAIDEFRMNHVDITRKLYFITTELKHEGVNTSIWQEKLNQIAPFLSSSSVGGGSSSSTSGNPNVFGQICEFYNSVDGCRAGSNCKYLHVTDKEAELRRKLYKRVEGRYEYKDVKFMDDCSDLKITTFYTYFGNQSDLKRKHGRSVSLLYSKKLKICPNCSLRITADAFSKHMKWHFHRRNLILKKKRESGFKSQQYGMCRNWYHDEETWLNSIDTNKAKKDLQKINPFESIKSMGALNSNNPNLQSLDINGSSNINNNDKDSDLYSESQVLLNGISQVVICQICREEFAKTNKEYNAQKDDWILKNACYVDGSTSKNYSNGKPVGNKLIVHRKCYELKKRQSTMDGDDDEDDPLKPKLHNPDNLMSKIEDQLNENGGKRIFLNKKKRNKKQNGRKRKLDDLFAASDDDMDDLYDDDDDEDEDEEHDGVHDDENQVNKNGADNDGQNGNTRKKRKLNMIGSENKHAQDVEEEDDEEDDLQGMGIDDIDGENAKPVTLYANNNEEDIDEENEQQEKNDNDENEENQNDQTEINDGTNEEEKDSTKANDENDKEDTEDIEGTEDVDLDDIDIDDIDDEELENIKLDDENEDEEEEDDIVLFDPNAMKNYHGQYVYGRY